MNVSSFYYNEDQEIAVVVLKNGEQYSFDSYNNSEELDGIVDQFIYKYEDSVEKFSPNQDEEVVNLDGDDWEDITHVYIDLKFVSGDYIPESLK